jgi:N-acetylated-alpha-linked acidic dipeptidase
MLTMPLLSAAIALTSCMISQADQHLPPWPADAREAYLAFEQALNAVPTPDSLREWHLLLASEPHVAGTPGDAREIQRIAKAFTDMGLDSHIHEFWPYLPRPVGAELEIIAPERLVLDLKERPLRQDPASAHADLTFGWNAFSGSGEVTAEVVYANYGTKADFEKLAAMNVDVRGKIVLARYGGNYRGYKAKFAQAAGAAGLVIYTDPGDSGYMKGLTYPEGGFANDCCIQRGSILTLPYQGDPLTPGEPATENAARLDPQTVAMQLIPVQPAAWAAA